MGTSTYQPAPIAGNPAAKPENIVETAVREGRRPFVIDGAASCVSDPEHTMITRVAVPQGWDVREYDDEALGSGPRHTRFAGQFTDVDSFLAYVEHHRDGDATALWIDYDPRSSRLRFTAVFDDHAPNVAGWRSHRATLEPRQSVEWQTWFANNGKWLTQLEFATFLQDNEADITFKEGYPTALDMHKLATDFKYRAELVAKSAVRLVDGTVKLEYADQPDEPTATALKMVELFCLGLPVFEGENEPAYRIDARLRVKPPLNSKLSFAYELVRADRVFAEASREMLKRVRESVAPELRVYQGGVA